MVLAAMELDDATRRELSDMEGGGAGYHSDSAAKIRAEKGVEREAAGLPTDLRPTIGKKIDTLVATARQIAHLNGVPEGGEEMEVVIRGAKTAAHGVVVQSMLNADQAKDASDYLEGIPAS